MFDSRLGFRLYVSDFRVNGRVRIEVTVKVCLTEDLILGFM